MITLHVRYLFPSLSNFSFHSFRKIQTIRLYAWNNRKNRNGYSGRIRAERWRLKKRHGTRTKMYERNFGEVLHSIYIGSTCFHPNKEYFPGLFCLSKSARIEMQCFKFHINASKCFKVIFTTQSICSF